MRYQKDVFIKKVHTKLAVDLYCKCHNCGEFFIITKRRAFCTTKCRRAAYYKRKIKPISIVSVGSTTTIVLPHINPGTVVKLRNIVGLDKHIKNKGRK